MLGTLVKEIKNKRMFSIVLHYTYYLDTISPVLTVNLAYDGNTLSLVKVLSFKGTCWNTTIGAW